MKNSITLAMIAAVAMLPCTAYTQEKAMKEKITQTAGRDQLENFAPQFAHFNDDVLFGEN